jgi:sulfur-carrier protein
MATVHLPRNLSALADGVETIHVDAPRVHELLAALSTRFPQMAEPLAEMAVAIDGEIYTQPGYQPLRPESEVHLLPRIAGG